MRHVVEFKLPKIFGKKKEIDSNAKSIHELGVEETIVETIADTKKVIFETNDKLKDTIKVAVPIVAALTVGYMFGMNRGLAKNPGEKIIVIK